MRTIDAIRRSGIGIEVDATLRAAADVMDRAGVGSLAVLDQGHVVGLVTDRDIVRRGVARGLPLDARVDAVMSSPAVTVDADADVRDAFAVFRTHAIRRLVVTRDGALVGLLTVDDLLVGLAGDLADLTRPVSAQLLAAHRDPPTPVAV